MRSLLIFITISVLAVAVQATEVKPRFNLKDILTDVNDKINNGNNMDISDITDLLDGNNGNINSIVDGIKDALDNLAATTKPPIVNQAQNEMIKELAIMNLEFFIKRSELDQAQKTVLIDLLPDLLEARTEEEIMKLLRPFLVVGLGSYFNDLNLIFSETPFQDAARMFLQQYYASPEAPDFLKNDPQLQADILAYVDQVFNSPNITSALMQIGEELGTYLDSASSDQFKQLIQTYLPSLYPLIQNEQTLTVQFTILYTYVVSQSVELYTSFMNIFTSFMTQSANTNNLLQIITQIIASLQNFDFQNVLQTN